MAVGVVTMVAPKAIAAERSLVKISDVEVAGYPEVEMRVRVLSPGTPENFEVTEAGKKVPDVKVREAGSDAVIATLLIDVSGSAQGAPLANAKKAAAVFIDRSRPQDKIAIVAFSGSPNRIIGFTSDKTALKAALGKLQAPAGGSRINDSVMESISAYGTAPKNGRTIILLSDGSDKRSKTYNSEVKAAAKRNGVTIYPIGLKGPEYKPATLRQLAEGTGGRMLVAPEPESLSTLYAGLSAGLHKEYILTYESVVEATSAKVDVATKVSGKELRGSTVVTGFPEPIDGSSGGLGRDFLDPYLAAGLAFFAVVVLAGAVALSVGKDKNQLAQQLKYYDQLRGNTRQEEDQGGGNVQRFLVAMIGSVSLKYGFTENAKKMLVQAGLPVKPHEYIILHIAGVMTAGFLVDVSFRLFWLTGGVVVLAVFLPLMALKFLIKRRIGIFDDQLPDTLNMLAGFMKAGYGLQQAIGSTASEAKPPMGPELERVNNQIQFGTPVEEALEEMALRTGSEPFKWFVVAVSIHHETGGNLTEILETMSATLRKRQVQKRQLKALSAEGRLSAAILLILPFAEAGILYWVNPEYMSLLVTTPTGIMILIVSGLLMLTGIVWVRKVVDIEV